MASANRLSCFGARYKGICDNHLTIRRDEVETRVLKALQERLLNQEPFEEFCEEFTREMNRLRMEQRASMTSAKREVARIGTRIKKLLNLMLDDEIAVDEAKAEMKTSTADERNWRASSRRRTNRHRSSPLRRDADSSDGLDATITPVARAVRKRFRRWQRSCPRRARRSAADACGS
jgi:site-specific DNA recombinase